MPSEPKPKKFVAQRRITIGARTYEVGDPVEDRRHIERLVRYGEQYIAPKRARTPAVDTATKQQPESTKED